MTPRLNSNTAVRYGCLMIALCGFAAAASWRSANADAQQPDEGLRGILAPEVPDGLTAADFAVLNGNWKDWSAETAADVAKLYTDEGLDVAGQRVVLKTLKSKLDVMEKSIADERYRSLSDQLISLHGKLQRRVDVAEAILDTLQASPETAKAARLKSAAQDVLAKLDDLKTALNKISGGPAWLDYVQAAELRSRLPKGESSSTDDKAVALVRDVLQKLEAKDRLNDAQRQFVNRPEFARLDGALDAFLHAAEVDVKPIDRAALRGELAALVQALEEYESGNQAEFAAQVRAGLKRIGTLAADNGDRLMDALRSHYLNYNLQVVASEDFLSRIVEEQRTEKGPVRDYILGADVYGNQRTTSDVGIDLKPSRDGARFDITLTGTTESSTSGYTSQATVYTQGYHRFRAAKEVVFDGDRFTTKPARISVQANNTTTGASTEFDGVPLFGSIGRSVAVSEARRKRPQSEAIAEQRVSDRVLPKFNTEVEKSIQRDNERLQTDLNGRLKETGLAPRVQSFRTSESYLRISSQVMGSGDLAGGTPDDALTQNKGVTVSAHESLLNRVADRLNLAGRSMSEAEIRADVAHFLSKLLGRDVQLGESKPEEPASADRDRFLFAESDPLRFQIDDGEVRLILRTGFHQEEKEDIPTQEVTIPLHYRVEGDRIQIERGNVKVSPVKRPQSVARQIAHAGVIRKKIETAIPDRSRDRTVVLKRENKPDVVLNVTQIKALDGWVTIWAE